MSNRTTLSQLRCTIVDDNGKRCTWIARPDHDEDTTALLALRHVAAVHSELFERELGKNSVQAVSAYEAELLRRLELRPTS